MLSTVATIALDVTPLIATETEGFVRKISEYVHSAKRSFTGAVREAALGRAESLDTQTVAEALCGATCDP